MSIQIGVVGADPFSDDGWTNLGVTTTEGFTFDGDGEAHNPEPVSFGPWPTVTLTATVPMIGTPWWAGLEAPEPAPTHSLLIVTKVPFHDVPPRKRKGLTGKKYRQARRRFRRHRQAWVRAGRPMLDQHIYLPRVRIEAAQ